ncbi:Tyrosine-protein phosphatase non-receptor type 9 [Aphelenchoides besseyi]|nr:Tyrosine-protein phosphatase non-receptor type 9 [Aphelenchoides besseyi]
MNRKKSINALEAVKKAGVSLEHGGVHSRTVLNIQKKTRVDALVQEFNDLKVDIQNVLNFGFQVSCPTANQLNHASFDKHPEKNRYKDIICVEDNRVKLVWPPGTTSDYIHANLIKGLPDMDKQVICTQGPTKETVEDFWRMIWQEKSSAIIMLCSVVENGKKKCEQYWPEKQGQTAS